MATHGAFVRMNGLTMSEWEGSSLMDDIERLGCKSARALRLMAPVTSLKRLRGVDSGHNLIAFVHRDQTVMGYIKYGNKRLYFHRADGRVFYVVMTCVLDFYVNKAVQRKGTGHALFEHFRTTVDKQARECAYDRPSPKLVAFLRKYYHIDVAQQSNRFAVTDDVLVQHPNGRCE